MILLQWSNVGWFSAIFILLECFGILSAFHALLYVRTSQAAVGWVVGLLTIPIIVLPIYWVFARNRFEGYREAIREVGQQHGRAVSAIIRELSTSDNVRTTSLSTPLESVADILDIPICGGNSFQLLIDGQAFFDAMVTQIRSAERYILAEFYTVRDDEIGNRIADALIERARAGVSVRLLYDEVGSLRLSNSYLQRLRESGIDVRAFNTRQGFVNRFQLNFRNHRKLLVVDGRTAIVGGLNIADEYLGNASWVTHWRDTAVQMTGPITRKVQAVFAGDYYWAARQPLEEVTWGECDERVDGMVTDGYAAVCSTGPADLRPRATMMFAAAASASKERLWISTPYFVPDESCFVAMSMARARGVDVRVLIPSVADQWPVFLAGFYYEREFLDADIPVYRYQDAVMHQKCILVDDSLALIGSTNLDNRSLYLNFELMVAIGDPAFVRQVSEMLEADFGNATLGNPNHTPDRPLLERIGTGIARLFSPVL